MAIKINPDDPAYPNDGVVNAYGVRVEEGTKGLSIRAELSARFMQGMMPAIGGIEHRFQDMAIEAVAAADALIAELNK